MLKLYHYWSSACSQKVRMCLAEKGLTWDSHHVDLFEFENFKPWYTRLNPKGVVPTLDHDGRIIIESNVILEYLDEVFPSAPLRPNNAHERAHMRLWTYNSEEMAHWPVNTASYNFRYVKRLEQKGVSKDDLMAAADRCPNPTIGLRVRHRALYGVSEEEENEASTKLEYLLDQMETQLLAGPWLAGNTYSLADIALAPMINRIEVLRYPEMTAAKRRPAVADWWQRIRARPAFVEAFSFANPEVNDPVKR